MAFETNSGNVEKRGGLSLRDAVTTDRVIDPGVVPRRHHFGHRLVAQLDHLQPAPGREVGVLES
ncbi:hypothetical protein [Nocardia testacea]|uniref:hypothetical protein n=1 Tax=Nocardia testacea TaxID=248551 RepID=UPI003A849BDF